MIRFSDERARDARVSGGKGAGLARLVAAGFPVPDGFVIPAAVMQGGSLSDDAREEVAAAYKELAGDGAVAVRSSALDEDSAEASFAGQHETVLDVRGTEALFEAIATCLASLTSEAAVAYRQQAGLTEAPEMAVVVQRMVAAERAGVAFSVDPLTGDASRVVIEAVRGTGEQLVSGEVEGDGVVLSRASLEVLEEHHPGEPVLDAQLAREAAAAAVRAEEAFGAPQDIEWAFEGGTLWVLQARPITTGGAQAGWVSEFDEPTSDDDVWTSANVQEILPGLLTPLTISVFQETVPRAYTMDYHSLKLLDKDEWPVFMGSFYNRVFLNVSATRLVGERAFGSTADAIEERYLGGVFEQTEKPTRRDQLGKLRYQLRSFLPLVKMMLTLRRGAKKYGARVLALDRKVRALDPAKVSDREIEAWRKRATDADVEMAKAHLRVTAAAGAAYDFVARLVRPVLGEETEGQLPTLFGGMRDVESAQISLDLWELSRVALREGLADAVKDEEFDPYSVENAAWSRAFGAFVERHGHRGLNEMEASVANWRRDPKPAMAVVRSFLDMPEEKSPVATLHRQERERLALTREVMRRTNVALRPLLKWALKEAQELVSLRERTKSLLVRGGRTTDHFVPELQRRFVERGLIEKPDDLFFLASREVRAILLGESDGNYREVVRRRRREYERNRYVVLPERFRGRPTPIEPAEAGHSGDVLTGTPVSTGSVTGRARVIIDPRIDPPIEPGEILVAPVTDAGWTPLFALAAGLVVDMGSALSHGSTVAREYGLPAVVNVRKATRTIRTGDLVAVNGAKGTVTILETKGES